MGLPRTGFASFDRHPGPWCELSAANPDLLPAVGAAKGARFRGESGRGMDAGVCTGGGAPPDLLAWVRATVLTVIGP